VNNMDGENICLDDWKRMMCYQQTRIVYDPPIVRNGCHVRIACETPDGIIPFPECWRCRYDHEINDYGAYFEYACKVCKIDPDYVPMIKERCMIGTLSLKTYSGE